MRSLLATLFLSLLLYSASAFATEGGGSTYALGGRDALAGLLPQPGAYLRYDYNFYKGRQKLQLANTVIETGSDLNIKLNLLRFLYVTEKKVYGADWGWGVTLPYSDVGLSIKATSLTTGGSSPAEAHKAGQGDLTLTPLILGWHAKAWHAIASLGLYIPVGDYDNRNLIKISRHRYAVDPAFAVTYLDPEYLYEISAAAGYTMSTRNRRTDYKSGDEFHFDAAALKRHASGAAFGAAGYAFKQMTADRGGGARYGAYRGQVFALGPLLSCTKKINGRNYTLTGKYYKEFNAKNRFEGSSTWLSLIASF